MSVADDNQEPTMEEILASIRRIISEDDEEGGEAAAEPQPVTDELDIVDAPEPEPVVEAAPEPESDLVFEDDVLELTDVAEAAGPAKAPDPIVSENVETSTGALFNQLSDVLVADYSGANNTLEALVRELLKPMLKQYLDDNLPKIVEDMVAREIMRISGKR